MPLHCVVAVAVAVVAAAAAVAVVGTGHGVAVVGGGSLGKGGSRRIPSGNIIRRRCSTGLFATRCFVFVFLRRMLWLFLMLL